MADEGYSTTPEGQANRWQVELQAAEDALKESFWECGDRAVKEYLGKGGVAQAGGKFRLNLFHADVATKRSVLSGFPKVRSKRRFPDPNDDVARVSAEMLERLLNTDIERDSDGYRTALGQARDDWLIPGLGVNRYRYVVETETRTIPAQVQTDPVTGMSVEVAPAVTKEVKTFEDVETDYWYWRDVLWSPARTWDAVRWFAFKLELTRDECKRRWPEDGARLPLKAKNKKEDELGPNKEAIGRAEVWEIWSKEGRKVCFHSRDLARTLEEQDDPLGLPGFFPCQRPLIANATSTNLEPMPSYEIVKGQYDEVHDLTRRIRLLVKAIKVVGVRDANHEGLNRLLEEACENELIAVPNWAAFASGDIAKAMAFLPIDMMVAVLAQLVQQRALVKQEIFETTGQSDIMRGQQTARETATTSRIKARFGASRISAEQDEYARFATDGQKIRAYIIAKFFDPETIKQRSNIAMTADAQYADAAVAMLKSDIAQYRIEVDSDSLALTDMDAVRTERTEFLQAMTAFLKEIAQVAPVAPQAMPYLLELGKYALAAFRGASSLEGVFDRMIEAAKNPPPQQPKPPDPKMIAETVKAGASAVEARADAEAAQIDVQRERMKFAKELATPVLRIQPSGLGVE